ncbi:cellulose synthase operon protein YhjQ/BcsQ [Brevundimonas sp. PAMC22021]|uniref:AAA family ATPase n=1 Tax=Brevundimonas sp. PAMC22021 TaxID=2861285 RepID=UPI001C6351B0|nr:cellulose synthase operon protein YhjQ/BcsQ [Brevundimonas sp. PAMC22021]QYF86109.1 pilus assembly protein CpaE [Brevundimonas sp. PAMC22021]
MSTINAAQGYDFDEEFELEFAGSPAAPGTQPMQPVQAMQPVAPVEPVLLAGDINPREPLPLPLTATAPSAASFNPVGDLLAGAQSALAPAIGEVSVPRIAIHVFAERQDTLAAAERAGQDRRLSRATTQIRVGGAPAAVEAYQHEPTPPLIIVECLQDPQTLLWQVDQLANVCDAGTKVIVIGPTNDILLFRELMRRGVSEYLVSPVQPLQLIGAIGGLFNDPAQPFVGRTVAFVGARGGAGASAVAHNTAYAISERIGANTVIVDYDLPFGTAGLDFNQDPLNGVADALGQPDRLDATLLDRMMVRCTDKLSLFAAPATLDADWDISPDAFEEVTTRIRSTAPFVVLDLPHLWSGWMRRTLISADEVVVVATPDLASLRNAKNMIDLIKSSRPNDAPPRLVLNQVGVPGRPEIPAKDFGAALGVLPSLVIPFDAKTFGAAANNGQMILDAGAKTKSAEAFQTLAQIVSRRELPVATKGKPNKAAAALPAPGKASTQGSDKASKSLFASLFKKR